MSAWAGAPQRTNATITPNVPRPVKVSHTMRPAVMARARDTSGNWSALTEALFVDPGESTLRVSEVMFNPRDADATEVDAVDDAEHRGAQPDAETERDHRNDGGPRTLQ